MTFRYLEHTADVGVEVKAGNLPQAFSEAGIALFGIMTDTDQFGPQESVEVSASGEDLESLLYSWLEELIYIFDTSNLIIVEIDVKDFSRDPPSIQAAVKGEKFEQARHGSGTEVKAITYHQMKIQETDEQALIRYFVDI